MSRYLMGLEQKSALQVLETLLELGGKANISTLINSVIGGQKSVYSAINVLDDLELITSEQKIIRGSRYIYLTSVGEQIAYKIVEIATILESQKFQKREKKTKIYSYEW